QSATDAGVGPDHIELAVFRHRLVDESLHVIFGAGVRHHGFDGSTGVADKLGGFLHAVAAVDRHQPGVFPGEQQGGGTSDATSRASDDDGFAFKAAHAFSPL